MDVLDYELVQEKASALGRLGRALESSLAALAAFDRTSLPGEARSAEARQRRAALVRDAGVALWHFAIQRDACGLRDFRFVLRHYQVPPEVVAQMGVHYPAGRRN